jgi:hypothetical protein
VGKIVVDTDVASYIFNWHSSAQLYVDALRGSQLILSFMSVAEMRMGAISAAGASGVVAYSSNSPRALASCLPTTHCALLGRRFGPTPAQLAGI